MSENTYILLSWKGEEQGQFTPSDIRRMWESEEISGLYQVVTDSGNMTVQEFISYEQEQSAKENIQQQQLAQAQAEADRHRIEQERIASENAQALELERQRFEQERLVNESEEQHRTGKIYYVYLEGQKKGPFSKENLLVMYNAGKINDSTQIWTSDLGEWVDLKGFSDITGGRSMPVQVSPILATRSNLAVQTPVQTRSSSFPVSIVVGFCLVAFAAIAFFAYQYLDKEGILPDSIGSGTGGLVEEHIEKKVGFIVCGFAAVNANGEKREAYVSTGSGFLVNAQGYIFTNKHVIEKTDNNSRATKMINRIKDVYDLEKFAPTIWVFFGRNEKYEAEVIHVSDSYDFAILKAKDMPESYYFKLSEKTDIARGTVVKTLGFPIASQDIRSYEEQVAIDATDKKTVQDYFSESDFHYIQKKGTVSVNKNVKGKGHLIEHDSTINPGNSGGPLIDESGLVYGINTWGVKTGSGTFFSLTMNQLKTEIAKYGIKIHWE